jgi:hypothetical protein
MMLHHQNQSHLLLAKFVIYFGFLIAIDAQHLEGDKNEILLHNPSAGHYDKIEMPFNPLSGKHLLVIPSEVRDY